MPAGLTRVLVAEDDEKTRSALAFLLQRHDFEVSVAGDGEEAFAQMIGPNPPQIVLLDWEMPLLDGLHVCRAVRSLPDSRYTYIIMLTARDEPKDMLAAFAAGVDDFISKPADAAQLLARLHCGQRVLGLETRYAERVAELEHALAEVRQLQRLLPVCMYCKKVRDDGDYWQEIEEYLHTQTGADVSHGICPACMEGVIKGGLPSDPVERAARQDE